MASQPLLSTNHNKHTTSSWIYRKHIGIFLQKLTAVVESLEAGSLLDAGCGEGFVVDHLHRHNPELKITGIDVSEAAVEYARANFGESGRFRTGSVYKLPFSDKSFDVVLCSEVLEHLDDPTAALLELKRVARTHVLITVPLEPYFQWLNTLGRLLRFNPDAGHVNFWTARTFEQFINAQFEGATFDRFQLYQLALIEL